MNLLLEVTTNSNYSTYVQWSFIAILVGGFLIAIIVGSIAWYNSKRPAGWEDADAPDWVPKVNLGKNKADSSEN